MAPSIRSWEAVGSRVIAILFVVSGSVAADVLTVDAQGGADFVGLQQAVDAASEGDTILVRSGGYGQVDVDGKSLAIVAAFSGEVRTRRVRVRNLGADQQVLLSGLECRERDPGLGGALVLQDVSGVFRAQGCSFLYDVLFIDSTPGGSGALVDACADAVFSDCRFEGRGRHPETGLRLCAGIESSSSRLALYGCLIQGAEGEWYSCCGSAPDGGSGLEARASTVFASGSEFRGGWGGDGECGVYPGDGGDALVLSDASRARTLDCTFVGGKRGLSGGFTCGLLYGAPGAGGVVEPGSEWTQLPGVARSVSAAGVLAPGEAAALELTGAPGDELFLHFADTGDWRDLPAQAGVLHLLGRLPLPGLSVGLLPDSGGTSVSIDLSPWVPPGSTQVHLQSSAIRADGEVVLGGPAQLVVVDSELEGFCQRPIHVDATAAPGGDGESWATAFDDLDRALERAHELVDAEICPLSAIRIWVAQGTYVPSVGSDPSFTIFEPFELYGGFDGTETTLEERDPESHVTVLSGDRNGDDGPGFSNYDDNCSTVVYVDLYAASARRWVLDGFTVRGGAGGRSGSGGGLRLRVGSGGTEAGVPRVENCRFEENRADSQGGGLWATSLSGCCGRVEVLRCRFASNLAGQRGGGAYIGPPTTVSHCSFGENEAGLEGGGLWVAGRNAEVTNSLFDRNRAPSGGGGWVGGFPTSSYEARFSSCTFHRNLAEVGAAGLGRSSGNLKIANSIFWRNETAGQSGEEQQVSFSPLPPVTIAHSCVQGWTGIHGGPGNIGADPGFSADRHLTLASPCVDTGTNALTPADVFDLDRDGVFDEPIPVDLDGGRRFVDVPGAPDAPGEIAPVIDMGAFERP